MKNLLILFFLLFSSSINASEFITKKIYCDFDKIKAKNYKGEYANDGWIDLTEYDLYGTPLIIKDKTITIWHKIYKDLDVPKEIYKVTDNGTNYIAGHTSSLDKDELGISVSNIIYDKRNGFVVKINYSEYGIIVYEGYCR